MDNRREPYRLADLERRTTAALEALELLTREVSEIRDRIIRARDRAAMRADIGLGANEGDTE